MNVGTLIELDLIDMGERLRPVDEDWAAILSASIAERGLDTPIQVTDADENGRHRLVAGAHRLTAFWRLKRAAIPAVIVHGDELELRLAEIDENLMRRELSELDRATFLLERKRVYEALHPETRHGGKRVSKKSKLSSVSTWSARFTAVMAEKLARNERGIQRLVRRAERLAPDVRALLQGTRVADIGRELDLLARMPPERQRAAARIIKQRGGDVRSALETMGLREKKAPEGAEDAEFAALTRAWRAASPGARSRFLHTEGLVAATGDAS